MDSEEEAIIKISEDFLESNSTSRMIRWVMVLFLLSCGIPQKTVASIANYTDRQVRNIRYSFENSDGDFPKGSGKRGRKKKIKKLADDLVRGSVDDLVVRICKICMEVRAEGAVCKLELCNAAEK